MNKPMSQPQPQGHLLAKEPDRIVTAMNNEERENRLIAAAAILLAILIAGATAYWLNQDEPMRTSPATSQSQHTAQVQPAATPLTGPEPAGAALPPETTVAPPAVEEAIRETLDAEVYFDVGRSGLREEARTLLAQQAEQVKAGGWIAHIQGYTDATGPVEYNRALGLRRAEAVKRYLVKLGVPPAVITVASLGTDGALCAEETPECRQRNRRVHVEFLKTGTPPASVDTSGIQGTSAEDVLQASDPLETATEAMAAAEPASAASATP